MSERNAQNDEYLARLNKLKTLIDSGVIAYKDSFDVTHKSSDIAKESNFRDFEEILRSPKESVKLAGRIMSERDHGGIVFLDVQDSKGTIQVALKEEVLGKKDMNFYHEFIDRGDYIGVSGEPFMTKQDKIAVMVTDFRLLSKAVKPLPVEHFGIKDIELKYRKRYLDTTLNPNTKERFLIRSKFVESLRRWLIEREFVEVVTRTLQPVAGGANAKPFITHHNMLDRDLFLRVSNELDLKMSIGAGFERVFEFAIDFRNEGIDSSHLQEFQMLEWYAAYKNYKDAINWTEELLKYAIKESIGTLEFTVEVDGKVHSIDLSKPIPVVSFADLLKGKGIDSQAEKEELAKIAKELGYTSDYISKRSRGNLLDDIYKKKIKPELIQPVIITNYPSDLLPLARRNDENEEVADAFQLVIGTWEIVKAYSELINPLEQEEAFKLQQKSKELGDDEAMPINYEFLEAMQHGFPPIVGFGMGIDRVIALITGQKNLKDTVLFPLLGDDKQ